MLTASERSGLAGLREAERYCHAMARREAKNFYWGFVALPRDQRTAIYALYDFARQIDDEADAVVRPRLRERLEPHRERVRRAVRGEYNDPVMHVLAHAVARFAIPERELQMLIDGMEMDFDRTRYETWPELARYCDLVASVVGRMCVRIFGFSDAAALERADELGLALQLTNILRDVREDAQLGRIYLPQEDLRRFGISEGQLLGGESMPAWDAFVRFEAARARELFERGYGVLRYIPRRPAVCVQTMAGIYERLLQKIERAPETVLHQRAALSRGEKLRVMAEAWLRAAG